MAEIRVVQLGCGITGLVCAEHLGKHPKVDELVLADSQTDAAESLIRRTHNDKMSTQKTDASNSQQLKKLLRRCDLVITAVPSEMNLQLIDAAISEGVSYMDLTVPLELIPKFEEMDEKCKSAGVIALTGGGSDPGISDVFAVRAAEKLDVVDEIHIRDADNATSKHHEFFTLWSPRDMLEEITMNAAVFEGGQITWLPPLNEKENFRFPSPIGTHPVYNTTHEETFLLPKFIEGLKRVDFKIVVQDNLVKLSSTLRKLNMHLTTPVTVKDVSVKPIDVVSQLMPRPVDLVGKVDGSSCVLVEVVGKRNGERTSLRTWVAITHDHAFKAYNTSATGYLVGTGAAAGAELIVSGDLRRNGLYTPEMLPTGKFVDNVNAKGLEVKHETIIA